MKPRHPVRNNLRERLGICQWFHFEDHAAVERTLSLMAELNLTNLRTGISWADYYRPGGKGWYDWQMKRGVFGDGYGIFSLVPKSIDPRGFDIYGLAGGVIFHGEDPATADPCRDVGDEATEITGYELLGEGTGDVELRFTQRRIDCKTREESQRVLRFRPRNGKFERVAD